VLHPTAANRRLDEGDRIRQRPQDEIDDSGFDDGIQARLLADRPIPWVIRKDRPALPPAEGLRGGPAGS
jgi:hypothetical protein